MYPTKADAMDAVARHTTTNRDKHDSEAEPRIWGMDAEPNSGRKTFIVATVPEFEAYYNTLSDREKCHYEYVVGGEPCLGYADVDVGDLALNPQFVSMEHLASIVKAAVMEEFEARHGTEFGPANTLKLRVYEESASSEVKGSLHLKLRPVARSREPVAWASSAHVKAFMAAVVRRLRSGPNAELSRSLKMKDCLDAEFEDWVGLSWSDVVDLGVYSRFQAFRLLGSSKLGQNRPLKPAVWGRAPARSFEESLVSVAPPHARLLKEPSVVAEVADGYSASGASVLWESSSPAVNAALSHLTDVVTDVDVRAYLSPVMTKAPPLAAGGAASSYLSVAAVGYRFCRNIDDRHTSNNGYFVIDFSQPAYRYVCLDPDCHDYREPWISFPEECHDAIVQAMGDERGAQQTSGKTSRSGVRKNMLSMKPGGSSGGRGTSGVGLDLADLSWTPTRSGVGGYSLASGARARGGRDRGSRSQLDGGRERRKNGRLKAGESVFRGGRPRPTVGGVLSHLLDSSPYVS